MKIIGIIFVVLLFTITPVTYAQEYPIPTDEVVATLNDVWKSEKLPYRILSLTAQNRLVNGRITAIHGKVQLACEDRKKVAVNWIFSERPSFASPEIERQLAKEGLKPMTIDYWIAILTAKPFVRETVTTTAVQLVLSFCYTSTTETFVAINLWATLDGSGFDRTWSPISPARFRELLR